MYDAGPIPEPWIAISAILADISITAVVRVTCSLSNDPVINFVTHVKHGHLLGESRMTNGAEQF